jgi:hypothetical protein
VSSVKDTVVSSFSSVVSGGVTTGSTASSVSYMYYALAAASGSDTITVTLSASPTVAFVTCAEWSGVFSVTPVTYSTGKNTGTSSPLGASVTSFTPNAGDLVYAYVGFTSCSSIGTVTYNTPTYTSGTAKGTDASTGVVCTGTTTHFMLNEADEYALDWGSGSTTSTFSIAMGSGAASGKTSGWGEIAVEFDPPASASPAASPASLNSAKAGPTVPLGAGPLGVASLVAPFVQIARSSNETPQCAVSDSAAATYAPTMIRGGLVL